MKKSLLFILMVVSLLLPALVSCGDTPQDTTTPSSDTTGSNQTEYLSDYDLERSTVSILYWEDARMQEFVAESSDNSSPVNDAIYKRNETVRNKLNVNLNFIPTIGGTGKNHGDYYNLVEVAARTGSGEYDILASYSCAIAYLSVNGYSRDLLEFDVLDFSADWWNASLSENATINNKLLFCAGDISTQLLYMMECVFFNTKMINSYDLENPYDLVQNNEWTLDKMLSVASGCYAELDGDDKKSEGDQFGVGVYNVALEAFFYGSGLTVCEVVDGRPVLSESYAGEKCYDLIAKLTEALSKNFFYMANGYEGIRNMFGEGRSLFLVDSPFVVDTNLNNYEDCIYGIVPAPKWDAAQDRYYASVRTTSTFYCIFAGSKNAANTAVAMEALAYYGNKFVYPALFETTMKYQYALDDAGSRMFDTIKASIIFDFGRSFNDLFAQSPIGTWRNKVATLDTNWISYMARVKPTFDKNIDSILINFDKFYGNK